MGELKIRVRQGDEARQLARVLKERAPGLQCRVCGGREFALLEQPDSNLRTTLRRVRVDRPDSRPDIQQVLLTLLCTTCGHIEQFAQAVIDGVSPDAYGTPVEDG